MIIENLHPTPNSSDCPICGDEDSLQYAVDETKYYRITELSREEVVGRWNGVTPEQTDDTRLFCTQCGEYFEVPENEDLSG